MVTKRVVYEALVYLLLFTILSFSVLVFLKQGSWLGIWEIYNHVYFSLLLAYTWFVLILLFLGDKKQSAVSLPSHQQIIPPKVAVIVPCFNEPAELLYRCIRSVILADGNKEILVVDDGSTDEKTKQLLRVFAKKTDVKIHFFEQNKGKRHALHYAIKNMIADADFVVTIDSDTLLDKQAITKIIGPFADPRVGATTGDVLLLNEKQNVLTRMIGAYYWIGLNIYKQAQSTVGMVVCCSGCLSAYRAPMLQGVVDAFVNQKFFGEQCTHSEDRHLTNLVLEGRYHVKFVPEAICYTETPATISGFLKQQQRWKRGYTREAIYTLSYAWKTRPLLFFEILLWDLTIPFFSFGLMLALAVTVFTNPTFFLTTMLPAWLIFMFVRYLPIIFYGRRKVPGLLLHMLFYDVFLYWQTIYAFFTVRNKRWITR